VLSWFFSPKAPCYVWSLQKVKSFSSCFTLSLLPFLHIIFLPTLPYLSSDFKIWEFCDNQYSLNVLIDIHKCAEYCLGGKVEMSPHMMVLHWWPYTLDIFIFYVTSKAQPRCCGMSSVCELTGYVLHQNGLCMHSWGTWDFQMCHSLVRGEAAALLTRLKGIQTEILNICSKSQILPR